MNTLYVLILYAVATHTQISHEPYYQYQTEAACETDKLILTDPNWTPAWVGECKPQGKAK